MKGPAGWAWLALVIVIIAYVAASNIWAIQTGHEIFIVAMWLGAFAGLTAHWFIRKGR